MTTPSAAPLERLPSWATLVRAPNPGPMTLSGTNTWILRGQHQGRVVASIVIDPGPLIQTHLAAVARAADGGAGSVTVIATHAHLDHVEGLARFLDICAGAQVWGEPDDEASRELAGLQVTVLRTPGHTADSISLVVSTGDEKAVLTGDTILGLGTTVVAYPDGDLGDYLDSLRRLEQLGAVPVLPGHGPALADCEAAARFYLRHRLARLDQVRSVCAAGTVGAADIVAEVYADVDRQLWPAAELSVRAQLAYLAREAAGQFSVGAP